MRVRPKQEQWTEVTSQDGMQRRATFSTQHVDSKNYSRASTRTARTKNGRLRFNQLASPNTQSQFAVRSSFTDPFEDELDFLFSRLQITARLIHLLLEMRLLRQTTAKSEQNLRVYACRCATATRDKTERENRQPSTGRTITPPVSTRDKTANEGRTVESANSLREFSNSKQ